MTISFNQIFGKRSEYRVKDFPELPNIEGLQLAFGTADLYKKKETIFVSFTLKMELRLLEYILNQQLNLTA